MELNKFRTLILILTINICLSNILFSDSFIGNNSINIAKSPRAAGMGNSFTGMANDGSAIEFNPAGLSQIKYPYISLMHLNHGSEMKCEYIHGALFDTQYGTLGGSVSYFHLADEEYNVSTFNYYDITASVAYSKKMFRKFSAGIAFNFINSKIDKYSASTVMLNIGALYKFEFLNYFNVEKENCAAGACFKNIGPGIKYGSQMENVPLAQNYGVYYKFNKYLNLSSDIIKESEMPIKFGLGIEANIYNSFKLRTGYMIGKGYKCFGTGIGFISKFKTFLVSTDFAYQMKNSLDNITYLSLTYYRKDNIKEQIKPVDKEVNNLLLTNIAAISQEKKESGNLDKMDSTNKITVLLLGVIISNASTTNTGFGLRLLNSIASNLRKYDNISITELDDYAYNERLFLREENANAINRFNIGFTIKGSFVEIGENINIRIEVVNYASSNTYAFNISVKKDDPTIFEIINNNIDTIFSNLKNK